VVFDKGVESISDNNYQFLIELCHKLKVLINESSSDDKRIEIYLNEKFQNIINSLKQELNYFSPLLDSTNNEKRCNDIKFIKISCHIMFIKEMNSFISDNQLKCQYNHIMTKLKDENFNNQFNCFIKKHLNDNSDSLNNVKDFIINLY
jgi:hypothetical protein